MKKLTLILILIVSFSNILSAQPNVLKCKKDCGILDTKGEFSFQAGLSMGSDKWGGNITFIENDIAISEAHVLGINPEKKICCTPKKIKKAAEDWKRFKNSMYVVEGNSYQGKQKIIGKVVDLENAINFPWRD
tara:strand:- start:2058 stop:2456 length:399 start_codon:yes stop_codon:yes gene_type:complete